MFEQIPHTLFILSASAKIPILGKDIDKDNLMTLDWFTPVSKDPLMCAIAIKKDRFTYNLLKKSNVFVLNLMPESRKKEVQYCGENSGEFLDKFEKTGLTRIDSRSIHCCSIKEAMARYECEIVKEIEQGTGDHVLFIAKISHFEEDAGAGNGGGKNKNTPLLHYMNDYAGVDYEKK